MRRKKGVFWRKARTVLTPFLVYYGVYVTSVLLLSWPLQMMAGVPGAGDGENAGRVLTGIEKLAGDYRETMIGIHEVLRQSFYRDPQVAACIADYERRVLDDRLSSFIAAKELLDIYFRERKE